MCGLVGILGHDYVAQDMYDALVTLQHRGQDAAGMITYDGRFHVRKDFGLVRDIFHTRHMKRLQGYAAVGHTRYPTIGENVLEDVQPFLGPAPFGVVLAHNGNVYNAPELRDEIFTKDHRLVNSDCDAEVLLNLLTKALTKQNPDHLKPMHVWKAVKSVYERARGAYSTVAYVAKQGMIAFRDPYGVRPLLMGKRTIGLATDYIFASESVTLDILGFELIGDVGAGEAVFIDEKDRKVYRKKLTKKTQVPCIFEYVYFARPDSILDNISVYKSRVRMGRKLAAKIKKAKLDIDVVMPVPDSSRTAALAIAEELDLRYSEGLVKNRYIGRTFIMPGQKIRKKSIRYKLNPMKLEIEGKKILLIDDSIVRGNTSRRIVQMMRDSGAKKIYFASYYPPVKHTCPYGIDIPTKEELIAGDLDVDEICKSIGADKLFYANIKDDFDSCVKGNKKMKDMCMACADGKYKTGVTEKELLSHATDRSTSRVCASLDERTDQDQQLNLV